MSSDTAARARRIAEIREREKRATKGPLVAGLDLPFVDNNNPDKRLVWSNSLMVADFRSVWINEEQSEANAAFYAHARADIPFLLEQLAAQSAPVEPNEQISAEQASRLPEHIRSRSVERAKQELAQESQSASVEEVAREIADRIITETRDRDQGTAIALSILRQHGYGVPWATKLREWFKGFMPAGTKVTDPQKFGEFLIQMASRDGDDLQLVANGFMEVGAQGQGVGPRCPKCGSDLSGTSGYMLQVFCRKCDTLFPVNHLSDFAQFFSPVLPLWVSVKERLPKSDGHTEFVLVCWKEEWRGRKLSTNAEDGSIASPSGIDTCFIPYFVARHYHQATHWQPLPSSPVPSPESATKEP